MKVVSVQRVLENWFPIRELQARHRCERRACARTRDEITAWNAVLFFCAHTIFFLTNHKRKNPSDLMQIFPLATAAVFFHRCFLYEHTSDKQFCKTYYFLKFILFNSWQAATNDSK